MQIYENAVLRRGSFPCRHATVGVILVAPWWLKQAERRVDHVQAQDAGADARRSAWMAAAQAGDVTAYQALLRDCIPIIKGVARRRGVSADHADDVVQDALLTIHRARQTYDPADRSPHGCPSSPIVGRSISCAVFAGSACARCTHRSHLRPFQGTAGSADQSQRDKPGCLASPRIHSETGTRLHFLVFGRHHRPHATATSTLSARMRLEAN